jgi:hypothetical protein
MTTKPIFVNQVTNVPVEWANNVSTLVYDVFGVATTLDEVRKQLGMATMSYQAANAVKITGGKINGTVIGDEIPAVGRFLRLTLTSLTPATPSEATSKQYVDVSVTSAIAGLRLQSMATQRNNNVQITGGTAIFDRLRCRGVPELSNDVVTLGYLESVGGTGVKQALTGMTVAADNRTVTTPFVSQTGKVVIFVDGVYQLPDQYEVVDAHTIRFFDVLPIGSIVGGFGG